MPDLIDLHIHTDHSDGRQTSQEVVEAGLSLGLKAVSITDHDTVSGYVEAAEYAADKDIEVISGIELSASETDDDIHILGYMFDPDNEQLAEALKKFRLIRYERGKKMMDRLEKIGIKIDYSEVVELAGKAPIGRPHVAELLAKYGHVKFYNDAFRKYLSLNGPVYVPKAKLTPKEAIDLIHHAGGLAVIAHPGLNIEDNMIEKLAGYGLDGIEILHPSHNRTARKKYRRMAEKLGIFCTGGSDSHNRTGRHGIIGEESVPYEYLIIMKSAKKNGGTF